MKNPDGDVGGGVEEGREEVFMCVRGREWVSEEKRLVVEDRGGEKKSGKGWEGKRKWVAI